MAKQRYHHNSEHEADQEAGTMTVRLDKWLWAARFYKTRTLAAEAIDGGHIEVNGQRGRAARPVQMGDRLTIVKAGDRWEIIVDGISSQRGGAANASQLYHESAEGQQRRLAAAELRRMQHAADGGVVGRPDKRQRRQIIRFRQS
jgi:ribosome-associated heat shock protein Hsp15